MVADYRRDHPDLDDPRSLIMAVIQELARAKRRARGEPVAGGSEIEAPALLEELGAGTPLPDWADDPALLERGQQAFADYGLYQAVALFCVALPLAYADEPTSKVLAGVSDLATRNLTRRVAETGQMLIDVMGMREGGGLNPGQAGHATATGLRILHSFVRALVLERREALRYDDGADGAPVNQELLLATLIDFSAVIWMAMERMGVRLSDADRAANLYVWSVFGHLMGIEVCRDGPLTLDDVGPLMDHFGRRLAPNPQGRRLMAALLGEMEGFMFLGWRKLPRSLMHWLFEDAGHGLDRVPRILGVPRPAWWSVPLFRTARAAHRRDRLPDPLRPVARWLLRRAGRQLMIGFADHHSGGQAPFQIPEEVARAWRIRTSPLVQRTRAVRRGVRNTVRGARRTGRPEEIGGERPGTRGA